MKPLSQFSSEELLILIMTLLVVFAAIFALLITIQVLSLFNHLLQKQGAEADIEVESIWQVWYKKLTNYVPMEKEATIMLHHDYDGIKELDNHLPPWWVYLFYGTIGFAAVYLFVFHVFNTAPLSGGEYKQELAAAKIQVDEYRKTMANSIDENNVTLLTKAEEIKPGEVIFANNCTACHMADGGGGIGPNLTDNYWLHGDGIKNVFLTVKNGVPAKGMVAWNTKLTPLEMQQVASFVVSLKGTKPANPKAPQGDLVGKEKPASPTDTITSALDSAKKILDTAVVAAMAK